MGIFKLKGVVQNYPWGGTEFIPKLLGQNVTGDPFAEYWMGAHAKAPSTETKSGKDLIKIINEKPSYFLGEAVYKKFGRLPYLFKVLDVRNMLSIQVHPTKSEAEKGYVSENNLGIPLSDPNRNFKDDNHKPEIMVALSDFWLLHGFRPFTSLLETLKNVPEFNHLIPIFESGSYLELYKYVMLEPQTESNKILTKVRDRLSNSNISWKKTSPEFWALRAFELFCDNQYMDKGIYSIFFFNLVQLKFGEGVFQDAGIPHAYLEGQNIELMANSDNVLRGGLTNKHVDINELIKHVNFDFVSPIVLKGQEVADGIEKVYSSHVLDFELSELQLNPGRKYLNKSTSLEIYIVIEGEANFYQNESKISAIRGEVVAVSAGIDYSIDSVSRALLFKSKCPFTIEDKY